MNKLSFLQGYMTKTSGVADDIAKKVTDLLPRPKLDYWEMKLWDADPEVYSRVFRDFYGKPSNRSDVAHDAYKQWNRKQKNVAKKTADKTKEVAKEAKNKPVKTETNIEPEMTQPSLFDL